MKKLLGIHGNPQQHWVGNGFPVRSLFSYMSLGQQISPFLLLDYAGPTAFPADGQRRGVGEHPHRGFETVTVVYQGEVEHRDSTGAGGRIGPGEVQWMTAGSGVVHEEYHAPEFSRSGGTLQMVQLWVNLPAAHKMTAPRYQTLTNASIPSVALPGGAGTLRVLAGQYQGTRGPAATYSPIDLWDLQVPPGQALALPQPDGRHVGLLVLRGSVQAGDHTVREGSMALFAREGSTVAATAGEAGATLLLLAGDPINEPIVGHGPFVMNTRDQIEQAYRDFHDGHFGRIPPVELAAQPAG